MERFITYMYAYENKTKGKNVGFVKVECRKDTCAMEIHIRNLGRYSGKCRTYLLMDENVIGVELGSIIISLGQGQTTYYFDRSNIEESGYRLEEVKAVRVECGNQEFLASCWSEDAGEWITRDVVPFEKDNCEEKPEIENAVDTTKSIEAYEQTTGEIRDKKNEIQDNTLTNNRFMKEMLNIKVDNSKTENNAIQHTGDELEKIDLADIRKLTATNWHYANNSFVIHGFMNYKYLIVLTAGDKRYLGVPGVYEKPEAMMAKLFGFSDFIDEKTHTRTMSEGAFGYWISQPL